MRKTLSLVAVFAIVFALIAGSIIVDRIRVKASVEVSSYTLSEIDKIGRIQLWGQMTGYNTPTIYTQFEIFKAQGITEVQIFVMSPGGLVSDCYGVVDSMEKAKRDGIHITTIARGMVASAAVPVFLAGDHRIAGMNTIFMLHTPDRGESKDPNYHEIMDLNEFRYFSLIAKYSNLLYPEAKKICDDYTWFTAVDAKNKYGMVDEIG